MSFGLVAVLGAIGGGRFGNAEGVGDNQSGSESNNEREGCCVWETREVDGKTGICGVLVRAGKSKSSSKVTHCLVGFPPGRGGWR